MRIKTTNQKILTAQEIDHLCYIINEAYYTSEKDFWPETYRRIATEELILINQNHRLFVAEVEDQVAGCVVVDHIDAQKGTFSILTVDFQFRRQGIAKKLVEGAENWAKTERKKTMLLNLLLPAKYTHPEKKKLDEWYQSIGYYPVSLEKFSSLHPELASILKIPCDFVKYEKDL